MPFPPPKSDKLQIFDTQPAATNTTFQAGVLATSTQQESLSIIMFSPNLQMIASLDNTNSSSTSTYETSVSTGFTFSTTQSISITEEVGVNIEVVTEKTSVTFALSFTEQWTTTRTTTMSFTCPPGKKSFVYQGTLMSKILHFDPATATYSWSGSTAKALTQILVTRDTPIGNAPSNSVSIRSS